MSNNFLKTIRERKRLSLPELSKMIGVTRQLLWGFENGKNNLSTEVLQELGKVLNCSVDQILGERSIESIDDSLDLAAKKSTLSTATNTSYPIREDYLRDAMEVVDEMIDHDNYTREEKADMLAEVYKLVYDFRENNDDKADFAKEIQKKIKANQGFLKFVNRVNFDKKPKDQDHTPQKKPKLKNG